MQKNLLTLAEYFTVKKPVIWQMLGTAVHPRSRKDLGAPLTKKQSAGIREMRRRCGFCVGGVAAEHFETELRVKPTEDLMYLQIAALTDILPADELPEKVAVRRYTDGMQAVHRILLQGRDYRSYAAAKGIDLGKGLELVAKYLHDACGAPQSCFAAAWPKSKKPQAVFRKAHRLNFGKEAAK